MKFILITGPQAVGKYGYIDIFKNYNAEIYIVELEADLEWSEKDLLKSTTKYRLNSRQNEIKEYNYIRINNTNISAKDVGKMIKERFNFSDRRQ